MRNVLTTHKQCGRYSKAGQIYRIQEASAAEQFNMAFATADPTKHCTSGMATARMLSEVRDRRGNKAEKKHLTVFSSLLL